MDKRDKQRRIGQSVAFYTALAVCLTAIGVGTWQLLRPEGAAPDAQSGTAAVSSAALLPDASTESDAASVSMGPDAPDAASAEPDAAPESVTENAPQAVSGAASVPKDAATSAASSSVKSADNSGAKSAGKSDAKSGAASNSAKSADSSKDASGAKSSGSSKAKKSEAVRPVEGEVVTAYSMDKLLYNETMRDWRTHDGIDIAAEAGTAVVAAKAGTVESVAADPVMGMTVTVRHEDKWETVYSSLTDAPEVEAGDEVSAGQVIGFVGETAASESALGPHLHFAVLNDGAPSDPEAFLS